MGVVTDELNLTVLYLCVAAREFCCIVFELRQI